jgi:hypothetical protein
MNKKNIINPKSKNPKSSIEPPEETLIQRNSIEWQNMLSELKKKTEMLQKSEERFRKIIDNNADSMIIIA